MASPDAEQPAPTEPARWRDLDMLLSRPGNLVEASFDPSPGLRDMLGSIVEVLVVGAGGLGCELLKDLALSGFKKLHVIDMDTIDVSNLNRQFLFRVQDVGKSKAEVAAKRVMERVSGVSIVPHFCRIEDKEIDFYSQFHIIVLGLDSIEARSYINSVACSFLEYDSIDNPLPETVKPMVDGGTEGFKGHARVIGVVKNIIPAIASTNAIISAACALEAFKLVSGCSKSVSNYLTYNGLEGTHIKVTEFVRDKDCLQLDLLWQFIKMLEEHPKLRISKASVTHEGNNLYMQSPEVLEQMTRPNLSVPMFELLKGVPCATVHATGMAENNGKKVSSLRKLRVAFKGVTGASNMDTTESS
nr:unnamed protein product [Digitaria exilis]